MRVKVTLVTKEPVLITMAQLHTIALALLVTFDATVILVKIIRIFNMPRWNFCAQYIILKLVGLNAMCNSVQ